jgi:hypothetical protein
MTDPVNPYSTYFSWAKTLTPIFNPTLIDKKDSIHQDTELPPLYVNRSSARIPLTTPKDYESKISQRNLGEILKSIVDTLQRVRTETTQEHSSLVDYEVNELIADNKKSTEIQIKKIDEQKELSVWDLLRRIFTCIGSALSIVIGGALIATGAGTIAGIAMITAGTLGVTSFILGETGVDPKIVGGLAIAGAVIGLGATLFNFALIAQELPRLITTIAVTLVSITEGSTQIGIAYQQYKIELLEAKNTDFDQSISWHKIDVQKELSEIGHLVKRFETAAQTATNIARDYQQLHKMIAQTYLG